MKPSWLCGNALGCFSVMTLAPKLFTATLELRGGAPDVRGEGDAAVDPPQRLSTSAAAAARGAARVSWDRWGHPQAAAWRARLS